MESEEQICLWFILPELWAFFKRTPAERLHLIRHKEKEPDEKSGSLFIWHESESPEIHHL